WALPSGGQVSAGTGQIATSGSQLNVTQTSQNLSINWQDFSIGANESVIFNQPGVSAIALNRVVGQNASEIMGSLQSNGQVFLINPNGVLFGSTAQVSVGGLVATTLGLGDSDFLAGNYRFSGTSTASVSNAGSLQAASGGYIALLGVTVTNAGQMAAPMGNVSLAAGQQVTLTLNNGSLVGLTVDQGAVDALASNHGLIQANGGQVLLTAEAVDQLAKAVVNNDGVIEAQTVSNQGGTIRLLADMSNGDVTVSGTLDASAPQGGNGGQIETSGARVQVADGTVVTTLAPGGANGTWIIDPEDFTIAPSGGDISGSTLSSSLGSGNVTILSSGGTLNPGGTGSVNVNDAVNWTANTLTLTAADNININAVMTAGGTAGLALNPATANGGQSAVSGGTINVALNGSGFTGRVDFVGGGNTLTINGTPYVIITTLGAAGDSSGTTLQGMQGNLGGHYALGANIDASATSTWNSGAGFAPIGGSSTPFSGVLEGLGHTITGLKVNRDPDDEGFFGVLQSGSAVRDVGLVAASILGAGSYYGAIAGASSGTLSNVFSTGVVNASGLLSSNVGGLVGMNQGTISNSWSSATVTAASSVAGGLAGWNNNGTINGSFASGAVSLVTGVEAGGLVGLNNGTIANTYAVGAVSGPAAYVGGLVGLQTLGQISNSYATGAVSTLSLNIGGLLGGLSGGTVTGSFWDTVTSGLLTSFGGLGLTDTQIRQASSFTGWSLSTVGGGGSTWRIYDGSTMPLLTGLLTPITVTPTFTTVYNAATQGNTGTLTYSVSPDLTQILGAPVYAGTGQNAGTYALNVSGLYSSQLGYDIAYATGTLTINKATLTLTAATNSKTYDGLTSAAAAVGVSGLQGTDSISGLTESYLSKNVLGTNGSTLAVNGGYLLSDGNGGLNYTVVTNTALGTITPATLTLNAVTNTKVYDGGTSAAGVVGVSGLLGTDSISGLTESYLSKNVLGTNGSTLAVNGGYLLNDGNGGLNYTVLTNTALGTITPATLTLSASGNTKVYDGGTSATGVVGVSGLLGTDAISGLTESYVSKNVLGTNGSTLTVNGGYLLNDGNGGLNYNVVTNTALGTITPATLTLSATSNTKVFDGTTSASAAVGVSGLAGTDTLTGLTESYLSKNVLGTNGSTLVVNGGYTLTDGNGGLNYTILTNTALGTITPATLTLSASGNTKVYDGTTSATGTVGVTGLFGADSVSGLTESYVSKNVLGTNGSAINVNSGFTLNDGNGGLNYTLV
ncbi:MAG TPA: YDG domain-containing protein, partial [Moraxellaceae bacterium]|nr:YDG domain-containing protein [Moraxellaceae bacterium]